MLIELGADEPTVAVLVRDHGVGLRPGEADLVFNRFWRAEESRARRSGGSGLGLSIALEDARLHGGWLQAWGEPGRGAAFRLTLPREVGDAVEASPLPLGPEEAAPALATSVPTPEPAVPSAPVDPAPGRPAVAAHPARVDGSWTDGGTADEPGSAGGAGAAARRVRAGRLRERAGQLAGAGAEPDRRRRRPGAATRPGGRQQRAGPGPGLRLRFRQQHRPARRRRAASWPRTPEWDDGASITVLGGQFDTVPASGGSDPIPGHHDPDPRHRARQDHRVRGVRAGPGGVHRGRLRGAGGRAVADLPAGRRRGGAAVGPARQLPHGAHLVRRPGPGAGRRRTCVTCRACRPARRPPGRWSCCWPGRPLRCRAPPPRSCGPGRSSAPTSP